MTTPSDVSRTRRLDTGDLEMDIIEERAAPGSGRKKKRKGKRKGSPPPFDRRAVYLGAGAAAVLVFAMGVWAFSNAAARSRAEDRLAALEEEKRSLSDALELHRTSKLELDTQLSACQEEHEKQVTELETTIEVCKSAQSDLEGQAQEVKRRLAELDSLASRFQKMVDTGDLEVRIRRGQMVVQLPSAVLFPSAGATLSPKGEKTLAKVAAILATMKNRKFTIAGHTDSVPIKSEEFRSNWELSSARAVTVTEALIGAGVPARNLVAAGYSKYAPIGNNRSARGRRLNRRIEIILEPDLGKLPLRALAKKE